MFGEDDDYSFGKWKQVEVYDNLSEGFVLLNACEEIAAMWAAANPDEFEAARMPGAGGWALQLLRQVAGTRLIHVRGAISSLFRSLPDELGPRRLRIQLRLFGINPCQKIRLHPYNDLNTLPGRDRPRLFRVATAFPYSLMLTLPAKKRAEGKVATFPWPQPETLFLEVTPHGYSLR